MTSWSIVVKTRRFDVPLYKSESKQAAMIYLKKVRKISPKQIRLKKTKNVRYLKEIFTEEVVLRSISV